MVKKEKVSKLLIFLFIILIIWNFLLLISPLLLQTGSLKDISGLTGVSDNEELINKMQFPYNLVYALGDRLCHQKSERSFFLNDNQMPFCCRCTAIWFGILIGLGIMIFYNIDLNEKFLFLIFIGVVPISIDGIGQLFGFWISTNIIRIITGLLVGIVCGIAIALIINEFRDIKIFKRVYNKIIER